MKADTYSFGVVVLEIISGQKSSELRDDADGEFLLQKVRNFTKFRNNLSDYLLICMSNETDL